MNTGSAIQVMNEQRLYEFLITVLSSGSKNQEISHTFYRPLLAKVYRRIK